MVFEKTRNSHKIDNFWLKSLIVLLLCLAAGLLGAKLQSIKSTSLNIQDIQPLPIDNTALSQLSDEIGQLKGRVLAIEAVRNGLSKAAGIDDKLSEIIIDSESIKNNGKTDQQQFKNKELSLDSLSAQLSDLQNDISLEEDLAYFIDLSLSEQTGFHASLPTYAPVKYPALSSSFGWRKNPVSGRNAMHEGLDFAAPWGTPIKAASGGIVSHAGPLGAYGNMVEIDHGNGLITRYAHLSKIMVKNGDLVNQGQK